MPFFVCGDDELCAGRGRRASITLTPDVDIKVRAAGLAGVEGDYEERSTQVRVFAGGHEWLDTPKNLSGRAFAEASGLVRLHNPDDSVCAWRERAEVDALLEAGWTLA